MISPQEISNYKQKYPFLDALIKEGYGKEHELFELCESNGTGGIEDCFTDGSSNAGGDFVSWRWSGIKDDKCIDLSMHKTVGDSLRNKTLDYIFCEEVLTIEFGDRSSSDRSISIYKIK